MIEGSRSKLADRKPPANERKALAQKHQDKNNWVIFDI
jgi:hypothetical protein